MQKETDLLICQNRETKNMSLLYRILKPIVRRVVKGSSLHREESYKEFNR